MERFGSDRSKSILNDSEISENSNGTQNMKLAELEAGLDMGC